MMDSTFLVAYVMRLWLFCLFLINLFLRRFFIWFWLFLFMRLILFYLFVLLILLLFILFILFKFLFLFFILFLVFIFIFLRFLFLFLNQFFSMLLLRWYFPLCFMSNRIIIIMIFFEFLNITWDNLPYLIIHFILLAWTLVAIFFKMIFMLIHLLLLCRLFFHEYSSF